MNNEMTNTKCQDSNSNLLESRFSESAERIEAKSISFERYFTAQYTAKIFVSQLLQLSLQKNGANLCLFNIGSAV